MSRTRRNRKEIRADDIYPLYFKHQAVNYFGEDAERYAVEYAVRRFGTVDVEEAKIRCVRMHYTENAKYLAPKYRRDDFNLHERKIRCRLREWTAAALRFGDYEDIDGWLDINHRHIGGWSL